MTVIVCLLLVGLLLAAAEAGRWFSHRHPSLTASTDAVDSMRRSMALLVPMTSLILGFLVANGKTAFDAQSASVSRIASSASQLDELLRHYGGGAATARIQLRAATGATVSALWDEKSSRPAAISRSRADNEDFVDAIMSLAPKDARQATIKEAAVAGVTQLVQERFYLATLQHSSFPAPVAAAIYAWLAIIFVVNGIGSPARRSVRAVEGAVALSAALAFWLVFELDDPFSGFVKVSDQPFQVVSTAMR